MPHLNVSTFPLVARIGTALFQGISRSGISADELQNFILGFFLEEELPQLHHEPMIVTKIDASDHEWSRFWSSAGAMAIPNNSDQSREFLISVIENLKYKSPNFR